MPINKRWCAILCLILAVVLLAGCNAARKPEVNNRNPVASENQQANTLANTATQVEGVKSAYVVVSGNMAVVGLDINRNASKSEVAQIKSQVGKQIASADKQINDVRIATDADSVTRIRNIANGIGQGKPVDSFAKELDDVVRRIAPTKES